MPLMADAAFADCGGVVACVGAAGPVCGISELFGGVTRLRIVPGGYSVASVIRGGWPKPCTHKVAIAAGARCTAIQASRLLPEPESPRTSVQALPLCSAY